MQVLLDLGNEKTKNKDWKALKNELNEAGKLKV